MTAVVGIDHGSRRIGIAVGDTETGMAFARPAVRARSAHAAAHEIGRIAEEAQATLVVVGVPLAPDGGEGAQAAAARAFGERLVEIGLEVTYEDERLSSWAAGEELATAGRRPDRRAGELDSAAARVILQQYLDARPPPGRLEETE